MKIQISSKTPFLGSQFLIIFGGNTVKIRGNMFEIATSDAKQDLGRFVNIDITIAIYQLSLSDLQLSILCIVEFFLSVSLSLSLSNPRAGRFRWMNKRIEEASRRRQVPNRSRDARKAVRMGS